MAKGTTSSKCVSGCPKTKGTLLIYAVKKPDDTDASGLKVSYSGPESGEGTTDADGFFERTGLTPGSYTFTVDADQSGEAYSGYSALPVSGTADVPADDSSYDIVELSNTNMVTPVVTPETGQTQAYLTEPDPDTPPAQIELDHLFKPDPAEVPDVTPVKLTFSYTETKPDKPYQGGGIVTGDGVTFFRNEDCSTPFDHTGGDTLTNAELKAGVDLWVRGTEEGTPDVGLTLEASGDPEITVTTGTPASLTVDPPVKRITPILEPEFLVVLKDRELWQQQRKNDSVDGSAAAAEDARIKPDPVRLVARIQESDGAATYSGQGTLTVPGNVDLFEDEDLTTAFDASAKIDYDKLSGDGLTLWMLGKTTGKFNISLELDASTDAALLVDPKAEGELGCVEVTYKLHHYKDTDVDKPIEPEVDDGDTYWNALKALDLQQAEMTDTEKVRPGRMLHSQDTERHHQRAKLVVQMVTEADWPDAAKTYDLCLSLADGDKKAKTRAGTLKAFTDAAGTTEQVLPHKMTFTAAKDATQELWIEGGDIGDGWRSVRLSLGVDRADGGPAKTPKQDGDWAAFSVVRIKEVLCNVENEAGREKVLDGDKFYINLHDDGRDLKDKAGISKCAVTAELEPKLQDVDIRFQVVEHADIYANAAAPDALKNKNVQALKQTLKPVDRPDPKKLLHHKAATDVNGLAKTEDLKAPQLGLAKFKIGAYLLQDAEQARHVQGHADLGKAEPVLSATWLQVWRRIFFKLFAMKRWSGTCYSDRFDEAGLVAQMEDLGITLEKKGESLDMAFSPALVEGAGTSGFLDWSRGPFGNGGEREMYLCLISGRHKRVTVRTINLGHPVTKVKQVTRNQLMRVRSTTTRSDWLESCEATHLGTTYDMASKTTLTQLEDFKFRIDVDFTEVWDNIKAANSGDPDGGVAKADAFLAAATVEFKWRESASSSGVSWYEAVVVCMDTREPSHPGQNAKDSATHTFLHEIGHYVGLAAQNMPIYKTATADKQNPNFYYYRAGPPVVSVPSLAKGTSGVGLGPHCDSDVGGGANNCIMWYQFKMTLAYCDTCKFHARARALALPATTKANARDDF